MKCWPWSHDWSEWVHISDIHHEYYFHTRSFKIGEVWACRCKKCGKPKRARHYF